MICMIHDCDKKIVAKGYCDKHYRRYQRHGNPLTTLKEHHGMYGIPEYQTWIGMHTRCYNQNDKYYYRYGGRGIKVCDKWKYSFSVFYNDMGEKPFPKAQIDRIHNNDDYTPENCRWVSNKINSWNRSTCKLCLPFAHKIRELYKSNLFTHKDLSMIYNVKETAIQYVIKNKTWVES